MSDAWPAYSGATPEFRTQIDHQHWLTQQGWTGPAPASDARLVALERRLASIEVLLGRDGQTLLGTIAGAVGEVVADLKREICGVAAVAHRRDQTAARTVVKDLVAEQLEAFGAVRFAGVWRAPVDYRPNELVSHGGSLWLSLIGSKAVRPGTAAVAWRMITKSGQA